MRYITIFLNFSVTVMFWTFSSVRFIVAYRGKINELTRVQLIDIAFLQSLVFTLWFMVVVAMYLILIQTFSLFS